MIELCIWIARILRLASMLGNSSVIARQMLSHISTCAIAQFYWSRYLTRGFQAEEFKSNRIYTTNRRLIYS